MSEDNKDDVFSEALKESLIEEEKVEVPESEITIPDNNAEIQRLSQEALALSHTIEGDPWDDLAKYMNGAGAQRMIAELHSMSSKDFTRNYLKILEHFKPKLVRSDSSPDEETDRTINIKLTQMTSDGEIRTIDINKVEQKRKKQ